MHVGLFRLSDASPKLDDDDGIRGRMGKMPTKY